jgi:cyclic beta-1,2-glucan synthetase
MKFQAAILDSVPASQEGELRQWSERGRAAAQSADAVQPKGRRAHATDRRQKLRDLVQRAAANSKAPNAAWITDNVRLLQAAEKDTRDFVAGAHDLPAVRAVRGRTSPRVCAIAKAYLAEAEFRFDEPLLLAFLAGYQELSALTLSEIWALKPALQLALVDRLLEGPAAQWPAALTSLRRMSDVLWKEVLEAASVVDRVLAQDPVDAYRAMDFESRELYRKAVGTLAEHSRRSEEQVAQAALELARQFAAISDGSAAAARRAHVGYYLIDDGRGLLEQQIGYRPRLREHLPRLMLRYPTAYYLTAIELTTIAIVIGMLSGLNAMVPIFAGLLLLLVPATQAAVDFINNLTTAVIRPRALAKLDFSEGIPDDCATMVAVPTLLLNENQVRDLVLELEIRFLANRDPNLYFALLTDTPDSNQATDESDTLVEFCRQLIEKLNRRYRSGRSAPFFLLHRHRVYNESEGRWMGWERKRGKLLDLNQVLRGGFDAFPVKVGDVTVFPRVRYVITLDSDTRLPRDSAARLVGTMAHPLNRAVVDAASRMVVEGYGILQPRIGISIQSASRSRMAALYSGQTGFDIYTRAISDVYQDLFGEGIFTGKGIYDVDVLREVLENRFPENALLSHDLIEGAYARVALVSDIELIDDYPSHFSAYTRRKHRWVRGDWQILRWVRVRVPDRTGRMMPNPISLISRWKIMDNLRRSLFEPLLLLLFLGAWLFLPRPAVYWTAAGLAVLFLPVYTSLLFALWRAPRQWRALGPWARETVHAFAKGNAVALLSLIFLLHQALVAVDAIVRSVVRVFITGRRLLEWETAAEAESTRRPKSRVDFYLVITPFIALAIAVLVWFLHRGSFTAAAPILALWVASRGLSNWLNRPARTSRCKVGREEAALLRESAERIWRYFSDWSSPATNWLIPDSVSEDGEAELRLSPTNLAMLLNARVAAVHLNLTAIEEFVFETRRTLDQVAQLPKFRGHLFNWYDIATRRPLDPQFISTVDSGNLAASLWTLKQAALAFAAEPPAKRGVSKGLAEELRAIADICHRLVHEMEFGFLYRPRKNVLSVGYDASAARLETSCYDLLATEARIASFVAIAKGDIPQEAWFRLGRAHTLFRGERVLLSWTGTMFEYLMPALWMRHFPDTILEQSMRTAVRVQREYGRRKGVPWGISESASVEEAGPHGYAPFGIPDLAVKRMADALVIAPYATFLAATVDPQSAVKNLEQMREFDWLGHYGFFESIDYRHGGAQPVRMWMAHHQGMSLLAIANLLADNPIQEYFHSEPQVLATELLLHERVPALALADQEVEFKPGDLAAEAA